jgi:hypothetical protein
MEAGFYKLEDGGTLLFGPNGVIGDGYELIRQDRETYTYPTGGWYWFDTESEARVFFNLPEPTLESPLNLPEIKSDLR